MTTPRTAEEPDDAEETCFDCYHPEHTLRTCHEMTGGSMPGDGPEYCPCSVEIIAMEQYITQLRAHAAPLIKGHAYWLTPALTADLKRTLAEPDR